MTFPRKYFLIHLIYNGYPYSSRFIHDDLYFTHDHGNNHLYRSHPYKNPHGSSYTEFRNMYFDRRLIFLFYFRGKNEFGEIGKNRLERHYKNAVY